MLINLNFRMKYLSIVSLALVIAVSTALPVPEDTSSTAAVKSSDEAKESSVSPVPVSDV